MYAYKKTMKKKVYMIAGLSLALVLTSAVALFLKVNEKDATPVIKEEDTPVIALPDKEKKFINPFEVDALIVKEFFDGNKHEVSDYTNLEGVYRPNQGIDYAYKDESFDVLCMMDGKVSEVKEDALFGKSVTIVSDFISITYQSLDAFACKEGDMIKQKDVLGKASKNAYNPELGNHVHIVVEKNNEIIDPKIILGKTLSELK